MMKKAIFLFVCLVASGSAPAATVLLTPSTLNPTTGSTFTVDVTLTGNPDEVVAFGFNSSSGPLVSFRSAALNSFFSPFPGPTGLDVAGFQFPGATASTVALATLTFLAGSTPGVVSVGITSDLSDPNQGLYFLDLALPPLDLTSSVSVSIRGTGVPEPGTFVLLSTAGAGLLLVRRRLA